MTAGKDMPLKEMRLRIDVNIQASLIEGSATRLANENWL